MKITKINSQLVVNNDKLTPASKVSTEDFSVYLHQDLDDPKIKGTRETTEITLKEDTTRSDFPVGSTSGDIVINRVRLVLDRLETFSELLSSSRFDPRKAEDIMSSVLGTSFGDDEKLTVDDPLKSVEEEVRMFSLIESVKWKRGDYL